MTQSTFDLITRPDDIRCHDDAQRIMLMQSCLALIKLNYADSTLAFKALDLAWEATRLAWYAVSQNDDGGKLKSLESSLAWVKYSLKANR